MNNGAMMTNTPNLHKITEIARQAGNIIMQHYAHPVDVTIKEDKSPVTAADIAANNYIVEQLKQLTPHIPIVAEENTVLMNKSGIDAHTFWLVDPLDGTKSYIKRTGEFTVNIALIHQGSPVLGAVYVPVKEELYYGEAGAGAYKQTGTEATKPIKARAQDSDGAVVIASHSHRTQETDAYISTIKVKSVRSAASSVKFCLLAEGVADIYPRFGRTMEWDTAAGHAVLLAAGGSVTTTSGAPLVYGKEGFENPHFLAYGAR
jgi:3'(2'), 5'-bisphosphate nucleotidase